MTRLTATAAIVAALALAGCGASKPPTASTPRTSPTTPAPAVAAADRATPAKHSLTRRQRAAINRQDHQSRAASRAEQDATRTRPLLDHLPLRIGTATIAIGGLEVDNRTVVVTIAAPGRTHEQALALYRDALATYHDTGNSYARR